MHKVQSPEKMEKVVYKAKPNGVADVWLRNNQHEIVQETEDGPTGYEADEIFCRVDAAVILEKEITADFGFWFDQLKDKEEGSLPMVLVGGLCFLFCGSINEFLGWDMLIWKQMFICAAGITAIEFLSGYILNIVLRLGIWDYSNMPFNIIGQICLPFTVAWYILSLLAIVLDDHLRYWIFGEEKPRYKWR